ncbi:hypothetical protein [Janthinobacterium sp. CG_23.3]|uniref:hypothetical protein n=1 Tax=Janthinobacterium sp. CG_23.3 TaxID=3349634 RepID=UPI0038D3BAAA
MFPRIYTKAEVDLIVNQNNARIAASTKMEGSVNRVARAVRSYILYSDKDVRQAMQGRIAKLRAAKTPALLHSSQQGGTRMRDLIELLQWPGMGASLLAAWLVGSRSARRRLLGFWVFLFSNVLWVMWGWNDGAWALIILNCCLAATNVRGIMKNDGG